MAEAAANELAADVEIDIFRGFADFSNFPIPVCRRHLFLNALFYHSVNA
jgi:hypothetical protein